MKQKKFYLQTVGAPSLFNGVIKKWEGAGMEQITTLLKKSLQSLLYKLSENFSGRKIFTVTLKLLFRVFFFYSCHTKAILLKFPRQLIQYLTSAYIQNLRKPKSCAFCKSYENFLRCNISMSVIIFLYLILQSVLPVSKQL